MKNQLRQVLQNKIRKVQRKTILSCEFDHSERSVKKEAII